MLARTTPLLAFALCLAGCSATIPEGQLRCDATHGCPSGWSCHSDGTCWSTGETDAGARDAGPGDAGAGDTGLDAGSDTGSDSALSDAGPTDAGPTDGGGSDTNTCASAAECDDGTFCNGPERCAPGVVGADARGCAPFDGTFDCGAGRTCDEAMHACASPCMIDADQDNDGHDAVECGGDDCDDGNAARYPGRVEDCDDIDNDCNPATIGSTDADGDTAVSSACCNTDDGGNTTCGTDCNDGVATTHPGATELCNTVDDDCDTAVDEGATHTYYRDADMDGAGATATTMIACNPPAGYVSLGNDCDDTSRARFPGNPEVCDGVDNDCAGGVDNGLTCACTGTMSRACGTDTGVCVAGTQTCMSGAWGTCTGSVGPTTEVCNAMDDDCDTMVDDGATCATRPNTTGTCSGACAYACVANFGACDGSTSDANGCEVDLRITATHCGTCAIACTSTAHAMTTSCVASACRVATCATGYGDCNGTYSDGCEITTTTSATNCGACGNVCPTRANSTPSCVASACRITCTSGFSNCDANDTNGCETPSANCTLMPPRLVGPLTDTVVTSRRPVLRFTVASGTDSAHVQVCSDAACSTVLFTGDGTSPMTVGADLPRGRLYWRAFGRAGSTVGTTPSATWRMINFATTTPTRASTGFTYLNVSGGAEDVAIGTPSQTGGTVSFYQDASPTVTQTLTAPAGALGFGAAVAAAGDVNGDGYGDIVVGACLGDGMDVAPTHCGGQVYVYTGTSSGTLNTSPFATLTRPAGATTQGYTVSSAGDFNGDGYGDFVAGDYYGNRAMLYLGATSAAGIVRRDLLPDGADPGEGMSTGMYGISVAGVGDANGDGYSDVVVGRALGTWARGYLYLGNAAGTVTTEVELADPMFSGTNLGISVTGLGDVNGDGLADIGLGGNATPGHAAIFTGSATWTASTSVTTAWLRYTGPGGNFGVSVIGPGDVNGDGYVDLAVSRANGTTSTSVSLLLGGTTPPATPFWTVNGTMDGYGRFLGRGGLGADTLAEVLVGECSGNDNNVVCTPTVQMIVGRTTTGTPTTTSWSGTGYFGQGVCR